MVVSHKNKFTCDSQINIYDNLKYSHYLIVQANLSSDYPVWIRVLNAAVCQQQSRKHRDLASMQLIQIGPSAGQLSDGQ